MEQLSRIDASRKAALERKVAKQQQFHCPRPQGSTTTKTSTDDGCWDNDSSVPLGCINHRTQGWWAFDSLNPNAWPAGLDYMRRSGADVVLMQEARVKDGLKKDDAEQTARNAKWSTKILPCEVAAAGRKSAGVAVGCRSFVGLSSVTAVTASQHLHQEGRFLMQKVAAMGKGGVHAGSAYFTTPLDPTPSPTASYDGPWPSRSPR